MNIELECKIPIESRMEIAERLDALGAEHEGDFHECNWVYNTSHVADTEGGFLLRLRTHEGEGGALLTIKRRAAPGGFKRVRELETKVESAEAMNEILDCMGFQKQWFYEKKRDNWLYKKCYIALDSLPFLGCFIEIEGPDEAVIGGLITELGLDPQKHLDSNYRSLFEQFCEDNSMPFGDMCFTSETGPDRH